jgi:uncharacterized protein
MSITMHSASVPVFARLLGNLSKWIDKAEAHAQAKKFDPSVYLAARLAPDMLSFTRQVQIACDTAKFCVARLAAIEAPKHEDTEASLADLQGRIAKTVAFLQSVPIEQIVGSEERDINVPRRDGVLVLKGEAYLKHYAHPNFYFHVTTAYALLRHNGVELGKADYLAGLTT